ncbi:MAG: 50S ribosomal protein L6 [Patescibacteria group bacterium]
MSKIGKKPIRMPSNVKIVLGKGGIVVEGPKGKIERKLPSVISVKEEDKTISVGLKGSKEEKNLWGTWRAHINNMVRGVTEGFEKDLKIEGIGWRANLEGKNLVLRVGFSHPVKVSSPEGITFSVKKEIIKISGVDIEKVGSTAAKIRDIQPPEPYKGKGIRYVGEVVRKKAGKKAIATTK